jgi:glycine betaine/proline transport system permease protein
MSIEHFLDPFQLLQVPFGRWVEQTLRWIVENFREFFQTIRFPIAFTLQAVQSGLISIPPLFFLIFSALLSWQIAGLRLAIIVVGCFVTIGLVGAWVDSMITLSIVLTAIIFCSLVGIPIGILASSRDRFAAILRPVLDLMQTIPSFVYLVPVVMLFGIGNVPGVIVTIFYALPPVIRFTNLGIRQVRADMVEAALAFGASPIQILAKVQIPLAMPTIMAGINQTIMMSLAMVVVGSMIAVNGLGEMVLRGIGRLDMGLASVGGLGVVMLAIAIDRLCQGLGQTRAQRDQRIWYETGPLGIVVFLSRWLILWIASFRRPMPRRTA